MKLDALVVECPRCGAWPLRSCTNEGGRSRSPHDERLVMARERRAALNERGQRLATHIAEELGGGHGGRSGRSDDKRAVVVPRNEGEDVTPAHLGADHGELLPSGAQNPLPTPFRELAERHRLAFLPLVVRQPDGDEVLYFEDTGRTWRLETNPLRIAKIT